MSLIQRGSPFGSACGDRPRLQENHQVVKLLVDIKLGRFRSSENFLSIFVQE